MEKTHAVYSTRTKIVRLIIWLFLALAAIITIFPVCYVIFGSFKDNKELLVGGSSILPSKWVFDNYVQAWKQANFATYTMNSVFLSLAVMLISLTMPAWQDTYLQERILRVRNFCICFS